MAQESQSKLVDKNEVVDSGTVSFLSQLIEPDDTCLPGKKSTDAILILSIIILKSLLAIAAFLIGFRILMNDEVARWLMLNTWVRSPFLAPVDHVWLGGFFYLCGTVMKIAGTSFAVCKIFPLLFSFGAIIAMYLLCQELCGTRFLSFWATFVYAAGFVNTWLSLSLMPEIFTIFFQTWGFYFLLKGFDKHHHWEVLTGCLGIGLSTSFRYEQWCLSAALSLVLIGLLIKRWIKSWTFVFSLILLNFYIAFWILLAWLRHGDPLILLKNAKNLNVTASGNPISFLWMNLKIDDGIVFAIGTFSMVFALFARNRNLRVYAVMSFIFSLLFIYIQKVGTAASIWRIAQGWRAMLIPFLPFAILLVRKLISSNTVHRYLAILLILSLPLYTVYQYRGMHELTRCGLSNSALALGEYLNFERKDSKLLPELKKAKPYIFLLMNKDDEKMPYFTVGYLSGLSAKRFPYDIKVPPRTDLLITRNRIMSEPYQLVINIGEWSIWRQTIAGEKGEEGKKP